MDFNSGRTPSPLRETAPFDPSLWFVPEVTRQEAMTMSNGPQSSSNQDSGTNLSDTITQPDAEATSPQMNLPDATDEEIQGILANGGNHINLPSNVTSSNPPPLANASAPPDFTEQHNDFEDFFNLLEQQFGPLLPADPTGVPDEPAVTQNTDDATQGAQPVNNRETPGSERTQNDVNLEGFETLGAVAVGASDSIPQPVSASPVAPQPVSGVANQVDPTTPTAALLGDSDWDELAAMNPPPPPFSPTVRNGNPGSSSPLRPYDEQQPLNVTPRMVINPRDRAALAPPNGVDKTQASKPKKVTKSLKNSDDARQQKEADTVAEALDHPRRSERSQAPSPEPDRDSERSTGTPEQVLALPSNPEQVSGDARDQEETVERAPEVPAPQPLLIRGQHARITLSGPIKRRPAAPRARRTRSARPRPAQRDRAQLRTQVTRASKKKAPGPGHRPVTRSATLAVH